MAWLVTAQLFRLLPNDIAIITLLRAKPTGANAYGIC
jgi:hypothetical protein